MYRFRFHGRGGQGMKTASRILGTAFFLEGYRVQDAPKYGAERRGAPMSAYVRADNREINERGVIHFPDLVIVADESLLSVIPEIISDGITSQTIILTNSSGNISEWKEKHNIESEIAYLPIKPDLKENENTHHLISTVCAAAAAGITGVISWKNVEKAVRDEHLSLKTDFIKENVEAAEYAYETIKKSSYKINESRDAENHVFTDPGWIDLVSERSGLSAPAVHKSCNSIKNNTGSWSSIHPVILEDLCSRCSLCNVYCPDNAIHLNSNGLPEVDYTHCKGCLICMAICPRHAIALKKETAAYKRTHFRGEL